MPMAPANCARAAAAELPDYVVKFIRYEDGIIRQQLHARRNPDRHDGLDTGPKYMAVTIELDDVYITRTGHKSDEKGAAWSPTKNRWSMPADP